MSSIREVWVFAHNIIRSGRQMVNDSLRPLGLSSAEGNVLLHLLTRGDTVRQDDLVEQLDVSKTAISRAIDSLEDKGFVRRAKDTSDRRASLVHLTAQAAHIAPKLEATYERVFAVAAAGIDPAEVAALVALFAKVSDNFDRVRESRGEGEAI